MIPCRFIRVYHRPCSRLSCFLWPRCSRPGNRPVWKIIAICRPWRRLGIIRPGNGPVWKIAIARIWIDRSCYRPVRSIISIDGIGINRSDRSIGLIISIAGVRVNGSGNRSVRSCWKCISVAGVWANRSVTNVSAARVWINRSCNRPIIGAIAVAIMRPVITWPVVSTVGPANDGPVIMVVVKLW